jgi:hypothetical protein
LNGNAHCLPILVKQAEKQDWNNEPYQAGLAGDMVSTTHCGVHMSEPKPFGKKKTSSSLGVHCS